MGIWLKSNALAIILWVFGIGLGAFNLYQANTLNAFALEGRVSNLETTATKQADIINRIPVIDDRQIRTSDDIREIKMSLAKLNDKLDTILSQRLSTGTTKSSRAIEITRQLPITIPTPLIVSAKVAGQSAEPSQKKVQEEESKPKKPEYPANAVLSLLGIK